MDFQKLSDFFGGCFFLDDYHILLRDFDTKIQTFKSESSNTEGHAIKHLLLGLHSAFCGQLAKGKEYLAKASLEANLSGDARLISRCDTYEYLLHALRREPSMLRSHYDDNGDWRRLDDVTSRAYDRQKNFIESRSTVWPYLGELDRLERNAINEFAKYPLDLRWGLSHVTLSITVKPCFSNHWSPLRP